MSEPIQPVYCSLAADIVCGGCAENWRGYMPEGCENINATKFECPRCHEDRGFPIRWWPAEIPKEFKLDPYEGE